MAKHLGFFRSIAFWSALLLLLVFAGLVGLVVSFYDVLDRWRLGGIGIVGLIFAGVGALGVWLQLLSDGDFSHWQKSFSGMGFYGGQIALFLLLFLGGAGGLLWAFEWLLAWLPQGLRYFLFLIAFSWYCFGVMRVMAWLAARGLIGPR